MKVVEGALGLTEKDAVRSLLTRLREQRLTRNWSQAEMAQRAGISRAAYQNFETGFGNITLMNLVRLMGVLGFLDRVAELLPVVEATRTLESLDRPIRLRARKRTTK